MTYWKKKSRKTMVEAIQFRAGGDIPRVCNWLAQQKTNIEGWLFHDTDVTVPTSKGPRVVRPSGWIIKNSRGKFTTLDAFAFAKDYEVAY